MPRSRQNRATVDQSEVAPLNFRVALDPAACRFARSSARSRKRKRKRRRRGTIIFPKDATASSSAHFGFPATSTPRRSKLRSRTASSRSHCRSWPRRKRKRKKSHKKWLDVADDLNSRNGAPWCPESSGRRKVRRRVSSVSQSISSIQPQVVEVLKPQENSVLSRTNAPHLGQPPEVAENSFLTRKD